QRGLEQTAEVGARPPPRGLRGLDHQVVDLVEPTGPLRRAGLLPLSTRTPTVPRVGGEPEDLRVHVQSIESGDEHVEEGAESQRVGFHRAREIEQESYGAIGLGPLRTSAEDSGIAWGGDQPGQPGGVEDSVLGVDQLVSVLYRLDD